MQVAMVGAMPPRVLVIDDEPDIGRLLSRALRREHEVVVEQDGRAALARLDGGETFDVILCDLMMPYMTGQEVIANLEQRHPAMLGRTIAISGGVIEPHDRAFLDRTIARLMPKPFTLAEAVAAVAAVIAANGALS